MIDAWQGGRSEKPPPRSPFCIPAIDAKLEQDAFSILSADLVRINHACSMLALLPDAAEDGRDDICRALIAFFRRDWRLHQDDVVSHLGSRLRAKLLVGDRTDEVLDELARQHLDDRIRFALISASLHALLDGQPIDLERFAAERDWFIEAQRRQSALKRVLVLAVARERLTPEDAVAVHRDMMSARKNPAPNHTGVV